MFVDFWLWNELICIFAYQLFQCTIYLFYLFVSIQFPKNFLHSFANARLEYYIKKCLSTTFSKFFIFFYIFFKLFQKHIRHDTRCFKKPPKKTLKPAIFTTKFRPKFFYFFENFSNLHHIKVFISPKVLTPEV